MKTSTEITYALVDPTAASDGGITTTTQQPWGTLYQIHDEYPEHALKCYGTMEPDEFILDGTYWLFPDDPSEEHMGLWSAELSDSTGKFQDPPVVTITFSQPHTSLGITIDCSPLSGDWASEMNIKWYDDNGAVMEDKDFKPDSGHYFCDCLQQNYYKVVLTFRATNKPIRYLKLSKVIYGVMEELGGENLFAANIIEEVAPSCASISVNTLNFQFYADRRLDLLDTTGVYAVFQQQQSVYVRQRVNDIIRDMGTFYTDIPSVSNQRIVTIDCIDLIGVIDQTQYKGGLWLAGITAADLIAEIMTSAGVVLDYTLDDSFKNVRITGYLPICTHREALQQVAFAIGAIVSCARSDKIQIVPFPKTVSEVIAPYDKVAGHIQTQREYVSGVEVYTHHYVREADVSELFKSTCKAGEEYVTFSNPADGLSCTGATIKEYGYNYAVLTVKAAGEVIVKGYTYEDQMSLGGSVYVGRAPANARANIRTVEDCTLTADAQAVAQRLYDYYQRRIEDEGDLFPIQACTGENVQVQTENSLTLTGIIESMDIDLTGGGIAKVVIVGG